MSGPTHPTEAHDYLSTSCWHGQHDRCRAGVAFDLDGKPFVKLPACCKICQAPCTCVCHTRSEV